MTREDIVAAIDAERDRQDRKFPGQWAAFAAAGELVPIHFAGRPLAEQSPGLVASFEMLAILTEEVGEVARALFSRDDANLTAELVQCAAVIVAWLEGRS